MSANKVKNRADKILEEYCQKYKTSLYKYAYLRTDHDKDAAEDCVQEAFMVIYKRLCKGEEFQQPKAFLYRTLDNFVKEHNKNLKKQKKVQDAVTYENTVFELPIMKNLDVQGEDEIIRAVFQAMPDKDKVIYRRRYIDKYSVKDIAKEYNISVSSVTTRLYRIRQNAEKIIKSELEERGIFND